MDKKVIITPRKTTMEFALNEKTVIVKAKFSAGSAVVDRLDFAKQLSTLSNQEKKDIEDEMKNRGIGLD